MKRPLVFILSLTLLIALPGGAVLPPAARALSPETITLVLKAPAYQLKPLDGGLTSIDAAGCAESGVTGQPMLPHQSVNVALPPDVVWTSLTLDVRDVQTTDLPGTYRLRLAEPYRIGGGPALDPTPQQDDGAAPPVARLVATGQMRKWCVARLDFCPFQYDAASGQLRVVERATVELRLTRTGEQTNAALLADTVLDDVAAEQFVNYAAAQAWYPPADRPSNVLYDYAIITTNAIVSGSTRLSAFIGHKLAQGHHIWLLTETDYNGLTGQAPNGRAEKIRQLLKDNYVTYGIKTVLFIGDPTPGGTGANAVPMKMCWPRNTQPTDKDAPTDYFFADLTGNWNYDGDSYYGEYWGDYKDGSDNYIPGSVDLFPEVYVGRIPFYGSFTDLDAILQKTIDYETETNIAWRKSALLPMSYIAAGEDTAPFATQMWDNFLNAAGYSRWRIYQQGTGPCPTDDSAYVSDEVLRGGTVVRDRWAANDYGIVCWWAHGGSTSAAVGYDLCWDGELFTSNDTASLDDDHPAFTFQNSCSTGYPEVTNNLQYAILKRGGVATVAASRVSFNCSPAGPFDHTDGNAGIGYAYVKRVVNGNTASEALYQAKFISAAHIIPSGDGGLMNMYDFNLYGDPDVRITDSSAPGREHLSIPAAAFRPISSQYDYENHGRFLKQFAGGTGNGLYLAPVQLPHGATITAVTFHWYDTLVGTEGAATLRRSNRTSASESNMAYAATFDESGYGSSRDNTITYATVDNVNYTYYVQWQIPSAAPEVWGCSVDVEYIPPATASKDYLSVPAAAFGPYEDGYGYNNMGALLTHYTGPGGSATRGWYLAPVQLPQGATVTKLTTYFYDGSATDDILARLQRSDMAGHYYEMAYADSSGYSAGYGNRSDTTISNAVINNAQNTYWVVWDLPAGGTASGIGVLIEYNNPAPVQPGRASLSSAAFTPYADDWQYQSHGRYLIHQGGGGATRAHYEAPVYLPQGARVTKLTFWFNDDSTTANGYAYLCRTDQTGNYSAMAFVDSYYAGGYASRADTTIDDPVINNSR
ncbi:MAG: hypothetical protein KJ734_03725, partial [Chloroflexi bacterium]|nr:hypothetical protein [Chloroflexota bacterium]